MFNQILILLRGSNWVYKTSYLVSTVIESLTSLKTCPLEGNFKNVIFYVLCCSTIIFETQFEPLIFLCFVALALLNEP